MANTGTPRRGLLAAKARATGRSSLVAYEYLMRLNIGSLDETAQTKIKACEYSYLALDVLMSNSGGSHKLPKSICQRAEKNAPHKLLKCRAMRLVCYGRAKLMNMLIIFIDTVSVNDLP